MDSRTLKTDVAQKGRRWAAYPHPMSGAQVDRKQSLDDHHVAPDTIKLSVLFIDAHFAKLQGTQESPTGRILDKDARDQLPQTCLLALLAEGGERQPPRSP